MERGKLHPVVSVLIAAAVIGAASLAARADFRYTLRGLGMLSGGSSSTAYGVSNLGQVVGKSTSSDGERAFSWSSDGGMQAIAPAGSVAKGINDSGEIVGGDSSNRAFYYNLATGLVYLDGHDAVAINNNGEVVLNGEGYCSFHSHYEARCFRGKPGHEVDIGEIDVWPGLDQYSSTWGAALNNNGKVVGTGWDSIGGGTMPFVSTDTGLQVFANEPAVQPRGINDSGQIVGTAAEAFIYTVAGGMQDLGALPGCYSSDAYAINNAGAVVGTSGGHAFVYTAAEGMLDLNSLIASGSGWTLVNAMDVNELGQIVGYGTDPAGRTEGFLLTPVPEPATVGLLIIGGVAILRKRNRG